MNKEVSGHQPKKPVVSKKVSDFINEIINKGTTASAQPITLPPKKILEKKSTFQPKNGAMGLSNFDIIKLVQHLKIPDFRGVFMRDTLPDKPREKECGVLNLNKSSEPGSHWVAFYKDGGKRIYFDSFGQVIPSELQRYLKTPEEFKENKPVIQRNTDIVQKED